MGLGIYKFPTIPKGLKTGEPAVSGRFSCSSIPAGKKSGEVHSLLKSMLSQPSSNEAPVDSRPAMKIGRTTIFW